ncbi:MAG: methylmalonyl Co-A mutase-associated GTPase MeaB [Geminicoccaceae bacterium]|nr:MAG: methylmalonyl Co-A mutase-associated GTPase MeaB [Geminicoccaceae bacterium]
MSLQLYDLKHGSKANLARALALIEAKGDDPAVLDLLDEAFADAKGHVIGVTGPPGVGKSTLVSALIGRLRERGETVGVIAVDPSSKRRGGALLGDRTRFVIDPDDAGVFVRSMAARDELGGLAALTMPAVVLMRALFDRVIVETVGVGQSETAIGDVADTIVFAVQPASGDSLQFMKAGIVEIPDIAVVTKGDLGGHADRAARELKGALELATDGEAERIAIHVVSATEGRGIDALMVSIDLHRSRLGGARQLAERHAEQSGLWLAKRIHDVFGRRGLARAGARLERAPRRPFRAYAELSAVLDANDKSTQDGTQGATVAASACN